MAESMETTQSVLPTASACFCTSESSFYQVPSTARRLNRLQVEFHFPDRSGASRHGAPGAVLPRHPLDRETVIRPRP
jgi:hypothetical protein